MFKGAIGGLGRVDLAEERWCRRPAGLGPQACNETSGPTQSLSVGESMALASETPAGS